MYIHIMYHGNNDTGLDIPQLEDNLVQSHIIFHFAQVLSHYSHEQQPKTLPGKVMRIGQT